MNASETVKNRNINEAATSRKVAELIERVSKFRTANRRYDYYPGNAAQQAVAWLRVRNPKLSLQQALDALIVAGRQHFEGQAKLVSGNNP